MILETLKLYAHRNFLTFETQFHSGLNIICGPNGSGKTSFLEALYVLSTGHSFRTRDIAPLIHYNESQLTVFAKTRDDQTVSIAKYHRQPTQVKINNQSCTSAAVLTKMLPCQVFYASIFQVIDAGPSVRREILDWGMFHVKHDFYETWKQYRRVLKQRNALLHKSNKKNDFLVWDKALVELADVLDQMRKTYFEQWSHHFYDQLSQLTDLDCELEYYKGWDKRNTHVSLQSVLDESFEMDKAKRYTHHGPHQADILITHQDKKAKHHFSRGQQKLILLALKTAQAQMLAEPCIYLFDDLKAELDDKNFNKTMDYVSNLKGQKFVTLLDDALCDEASFKIYLM